MVGPGHAMTQAWAATQTRENVKSRKVIWTSPDFYFLIEFIFFWTSPEIFFYKGKINSGLVQKYFFTNEKCILDWSRNICLQRKNKFWTGPEIFFYKGNRNSGLVQDFLFTRHTKFLTWLRMCLLVWASACVHSGHYTGHSLLSLSVFQKDFT